ncbi:MAG: DUF354 domain-containing protein [Dehalococcoidales bacterium]|nr:DUF354 domain-containing protein [Dehalococcoidales bacterium]
MKILVSVQHPAWAHQFRYVIKELEKRGHTVKVLAINKDRDLELLDAFGIDYDVISRSSGKNILEKGMIFLNTVWQIFKKSWVFKPDMYIGRASPMMAINSFLFRKPHIVFEDTELSGFCLELAKLFTDVIITPNCFRKDLGRKQIRINAYKETFYLHPNYFTPDKSVLSRIGLSPDDRLIILRFVSWQAHHDFGHKGLTIDEKRKVVEEFSKYGRVLISSEGPLPEEFEPYRITVSAENLHHLLSYASLHFGEGGSVATEAAMLGTPSIFISPLAKDLGNFQELESKYDIVYSFQDTEKAIQKAVELLKLPDLKAQWGEKQRVLLSEQIDITRFMVDFYENYPASANSAKTNMKGTS